MFTAWYVLVLQRVQIASSLYIVSGDVEALLAGQFGRSELVNMLMIVVPK